MSERRADLESAASLLRPEPILVPPPDAAPAGLHSEWWIEEYDEGKFGAALYHLKTGSPEQMESGELVAAGAWWFSQSTGEAYRTGFGSEVWQRRSKQVEVRGNPGMQVRAGLDGSDEICMLFWNEPAKRDDPQTVRRYALASPEPTCDGSEQLDYANALQER